MIKICNSVSCWQFCNQSVRHVPKQCTTIDSRELDCVQNSSLSSDCWKGTDVVVSQEAEKLMPKTGTPDWKYVAFVVLLHRVFEDVIGIGGPSVGDVELDTSSWEKDTVDFR